MTAQADGTHQKTPGIGTFDPAAQEQWGRSVRVAMALINGPGNTDNFHADDGFRKSGGNRGGDCSEKQHGLPAEQTAIRNRLESLSRKQSASLADLIELLVRFDDLRGWEAGGFKHCIAWTNSELGISNSLAWEYFRVGRELRSLRTLTALFRSGNLTWSKVRLISRVADAENELLLCHAALDASVSDVARICREFRWKKESAEDTARSENARALHQHESRALTWREASNGNISFSLCLPPELAAAFLRSLEHCVELQNAKTQTSEGDVCCELTADCSKPANSGEAESLIGTNRFNANADVSLSQKRADAVMLMAERSLAYAGSSVASADRYLVVINTDVEGLARQDNRSGQEPVSGSTRDDFESSASYLPEQRPVIQGTGPIARETARRIACDASLVSITTRNGEPLDITRKSRQWTPAISRAIHHRDGHCQWPGCTAVRHLHIHHIKHWADGGCTSVENGVLCCHSHHVLLHEGGYRFEHVSTASPDLDAQFRAQTTRPDGAHQSDEEAALRNSRTSFEAVRALLTTRCRFRVITPDGKDVADSDVNETADDSTHVESIIGCEDRISEQMTPYRVVRRSLRSAPQQCVCHGAPACILSKGYGPRGAFRFTPPA